MPLNGAGVASKPSGTTAVTQTVIESSKFNSVIDDIYAILNTAAKFADGTVSAPNGFAADPDTGFYRIGADNIGFAIGGALELDLNGTRLAPGASDGSALGSASLMWSDLFLASGAVINFNNGDVTITHSANTLAFAGAASGYTYDGNILLSKASPTLTIRKSAAAQFGSIAFENGASSRWLTGVDSTAEGGANAGSDFFINRYNDAGSFLGTPVAVSRATGVVTFGSGISFGGSTLSAYAEGSWTPSVGGNATYSVQGGRYIKIGKLVWIVGRLTIATNGTGSQNAISGLPFTAASSVDLNPVSFGEISSTTNVVSVTGTIAAGGTTIQIRNRTAAAGADNTATNILGSAGSSVSFSAMYEAAS